MLNSLNKAWPSSDFFQGVATFSGGGGQKHTICLIKYYFHPKKLKNILFWPAKGGKCPLLPSPADAHEVKLCWVRFCKVAITSTAIMHSYFPRDRYGSDVPFYICFVLKGKKC